MRRSRCCLSAISASAVIRMRLRVGSHAEKVVNVLLSAGDAATLLHQSSPLIALSRSFAATASCSFASIGSRFFASSIASRSLASSCSAGQALGKSLL
jgi:hypothetical protein